MHAHARPFMQGFPLLAVGTWCNFASVNDALG